MRVWAGLLRLKVGRKENLGAPGVRKQIGDGPPTERQTDNNWERCGERNCGLTAVLFPPGTQPHLVKLWCV